MAASQSEAQSRGGSPAQSTALAFCCRSLLSESFLARNIARVHRLRELVQYFLVDSHLQRALSVSDQVLGAQLLIRLLSYVFRLFLLRRVPGEIALSFI